MRAVAANAHVLECTVAPGLALCRVSSIAAWTTADWSNPQAGTKERVERLERGKIAGVSIAAH